MQTYFAGFGIGDALRIVAVLQQRKGPQHVAVESEPYRGAVEVFEALDPLFNITHEPIPRGAWDASILEDRADLQCPEALHYTSRVASGPLGLHQLTFRKTRLERILSEFLDSRGYVVIQAATTFNKPRVFAAVDAYRLRKVMIGSTEDAGPPVHGAIDLRGQLTLRESFEVVRRATAVVGVESWAPILGALWGKPVVHQISRRASRDLLPNWSILFPTMGFRIEDQ